MGPRNFDRASQELSAAGVEVQPTPPAFDSGHKVDHAKLLVLDGQQLLFGPGNLVRSGLGGNADDTYDNRDFWVEDARAPSVREAEALFEADWARKPTDASTFQNLVVTPDNAEARSAP